MFRLNDVALANLLEQMQVIQVIANRDGFAMRQLRILVNDMTQYIAFTQWMLFAAVVVVEGGVD